MNAEYLQILASAPPGKHLNVKGDYSRTRASDFKHLPAVIK